MKLHIKIEVEAATREEAVSFFAGLVERCRKNDWRDTFQAGGGGGGPYFQLFIGVKNA